MRSIGRANWRRRRTRKALTAAPGSTQTEEITSWRGALQSQITAALLDALQTTVGIGCLVRIVLVEAGMHAGFAGGFVRVLREHGRWEDRVPPSPRRRGRGVTTRQSVYRPYRVVYGELANNSTNHGACTAVRFHCAQLFLAVLRGMSLHRLFSMLWHELCDPSQYERGVPPFRDVQHCDAWPLPRGGGRRA